MVIAGKANGIETMRFIVSTNCAHVSVCYAIHNNAKALKGRALSGLFLMSFRNFGRTKVRPYTVRV